MLRRVSWLKGKVGGREREEERKEGRTVFSASFVTLLVPFSALEERRSWRGNAQKIMRTVRKWV